MTKRWSRTVVVTLFILLAFTASASAECAWVLWSNLLSSNPVSRYAASTGGLWIPESAGTRTECEKARDGTLISSVAAEAMGQGTRALAGGAVMGVVGPNGQVLFSCLPDTVDPRGPQRAR